MTNLCTSSILQCVGTIDKICRSVSVYPPIRTVSLEEEAKLCPPDCRGKSVVYLSIKQTKRKLRQMLWACAVAILAVFAVPVFRLLKIQKDAKIPESFLAALFLVAFVVTSVTLLVQSSIRIGEVLDHTNYDGPFGLSHLVNPNFWRVIPAVAICVLFLSLSVGLVSKMFAVGWFLAAFAVGFLSFLIGILHAMLRTLPNRCDAAFSSKGWVGRQNLSEKHLMVIPIPISILVGAIAVFYIDYVLKLLRSS
jgi:hypothetical protein